MASARRYSPRKRGELECACEAAPCQTDAGDVLGAIKLEGLWNDLAREIPFALLCSYRDPAGSHMEQASADALAQVCEAHSACHHAWSDDATGAIDASAATGARADLPSKPSTPGYARRLTAQALRQWGYSPAATHDAGLIVSELVTNAVLHAQSPVTLTVHCDENQFLRIAVHDSTPLTTPVPTTPFPATPTHGLGIVATVSAKWGVEPLRDGKIVWAHIPT